MSDLKSREEAKGGDDAATTTTTNGPTTTTTTTTTTSTTIPKKLFTELSELRSDGDLSYWKETARWVKYEEEVEEGGERWSKPHVATLSLKALAELREIISTESLILDAEVATMDDIAVLVKNKYRGKLTDEQRDIIFDYLRTDNIHQHQKRIIRSDESSNGSIKYNETFMRKVPEGTEAHVVLLGELPTLDKGQQVSLFIRLSQSHLLERHTEIAVPTKFVTILLRSATDGGDVKEVARCIATLMSDDVFREVAYMASSAADFRSGVDEFMNASTVLPPSTWDPKTRVDPPDQLPAGNNRINPVRMASECSDTNGNPDEVTKMLAKNVEAKSSVDDMDERIQEWRENGLLRSGRLFGGLVSDVKRKIPFYFSDFRDALNLKALASFFFIYFACLSSQITFGGIHAEATKDWIGTEEGLLGASVCGCVYALLSAQPLTILGCTGPILVFETIFFHLCEAYGLPYLTIRFWCGTWCAFLLLLCVAFDLSFMVVFVTRFTEECFATLIAIIFIYEAFHSLFSLYELTPFQMHVKHTHHRTHGSPHADLLNASDAHPLTTAMMASVSPTNATIADHAANDEFVPDVFLFSVLLFLGTFVIAYSLKFFKFARFFPTGFRSILSDFSVFIAILLMTAANVALDLDTERLHVPTEFEPTLHEERGWLVDPGKGIPTWCIFGAILPAFLLAILIFMDQNITLVIINRKENKLRKGSGYHLDLLVVAFLIFFSSLLGLPFMVAATVRSMTHVNSLKVESSIQAPGEKPQFLGIKEQRMTAFMAHFAIGLSVLLSGVLKMVPMPVLYGIFLFMGVSSLGGLQFFERILILFMPLKHQPDRPYLRRVRPKRVYLFTFVQALGFIILYVFKHFEQTCLVFPIMIMGLMVIRKLLDFVFEPDELMALDDPLPPWNQLYHGNKRSTDFDEKA